ncbi:IclR family transcriptional regulator, partial [Thermanaerothrix sp.]
MSPRRASSEEKNNRYNVRVLDRAINILLTLADGKPRTLQEVSDAISLSPSTTFRLLATLSCYKFVQKDALGRYSLGLTCLELARAYYESNDLRKVALPELEALRDEVKETVHLAILEGTEVVYLEKLP